MKELKPNQIGPWCSYCPSKTTKAVYRQNNWYGKFCCKSHKENLKEYEIKLLKRDQNITEADHQTWIRL